MHFTNTHNLSRISPPCTEGYFTVKTIFDTYTNWHHSFNACLKCTAVARSVLASTLTLPNYRRARQTLLMAAFRQQYTVGYISKVEKFMVFVEGVKSLFCQTDFFLHTSV